MVDVITCQNCTITTVGVTLCINCQNRAFNEAWRAPYEKHWKECKKPICPTCCRDGKGDFPIIKKKRSSEPHPRSIAECPATADRSLKRMRCLLK